MLKFSARIIVSIVILPVIYFAGGNCAFAQYLLTRQEIPGEDRDYINIGMDKIVNTYNFFSGGNYHVSSTFGSVDLLQNFRSTLVRSATDSYQDNEDFRFKYLFDYNKYFALSATQNWFFSSNTKSIGINDLERLNGGGGFRFTLPGTLWIEGLAGVEGNKQAGMKTNGTFYLLNGQTGNLDLDGYKINSQLAGEFLFLNDTRKNTDLLFGAVVNKEYTPEDKFYVRVTYKQQGRDFLNLSVPDSLEKSMIETRNENRFGADANLSVGLMDNISANVKINIENIGVGRSYKQYSESVPLSGTKRELSEIDMGLNSELVYSAKNLDQTFSMGFFSRSEENLIYKKFLITDIDYIKLKAIENQRDNNTSRTTLSTKTRFKPGTKDTFELSYNVQLQRYQTPSEDNYDDRDEFTSFTTFKWNRGFNDNLGMGLQADLTMNHLVYLKSKRSALNNWNRIIRFNPSIFIIFDKFVMNPQFEVLANYTVYDFEKLDIGVKSFSFRQLTYRDTAALMLTGRVGVTARVLLKYSERGVLFWEKFAETPQNSNFEKFAKVMLICKLNRVSMIGSGVRFYSLSRQPIKTEGQLGAGASYEQVSIGPEFVLKYLFASGSEINVNGWYELQKINRISVNDVPNIFLNTKIKL